MTRYSRSVIPGRPGDAPQDNPNLDRMVFGAKRKPPAAANDEPDFLPTMDADEADLLVARSNTNRRQGPDRRTETVDRRKSAGRRTSEYAPLNEGGRGARTPDDSKRGPLLLAGALMIVVVFGVVVWNAYSDGLAGDGAEVTPELATGGTFKTPPRVVEAAPVVAEPVDVAPESALDGGESTVAEERPAPPAAEAELTPQPSKVTAPPPAPLKTPPQAAVTPPPAKAEPAKVEPASSAAAPAPAAVATATPGAYAPAFAAYGDHVVQIAATSTEASATTEWTRLSKAHPELLSGAERFIIQADVGGKTVYRLRIGSFTTKADAVAFCAAFKAKGGNCLPAVK